jgi:tRNA nucleotidyltransferase (CCA-adding enzyme)
VCNRLRVPNDCRELADVVAREHGNVHRSGEFGAAAVVRLLERCDAFRKPQRFELVLLACECDARGRLGLEERPYPQRPRLLAALTVARSVATKSIAIQAQQEQASGPKIAEMIQKARVDAVGAELTIASKSLASKNDPQETP